MRLTNIDIFDEVLTGSGTTWYTPTRLNDTLGAADAFAVQATTTLVSGTLPTLTVQAQHSSDDQNWLATPSAEISTGIAEGGSYVGAQTVSSVGLLANVRFAITLGGTSPQCRLKLSFTGRVHAGRPQGASASPAEAREPARAAPAGRRTP